MVNTEANGCKKNMAVKRAERGYHVEMFDDSLHSVSIFKNSMIHASISQLLSSFSHWDSCFRIFFAPVHKSYKSTLTLIFSAHPAV